MRVQVVPAQHGGVVSPSGSFPVVVADARPTVDIVTNPEGQDAVTETIPVVNVEAESAPGAVEEPKVEPRPSRRRLIPPMELDEATPLFDRLVADAYPDLFGSRAQEADRLLSEAFADWGLDELAPPTLSELIELLVERVGPQGVPDELIWTVRPVAVEGGDHERGDRSVGASQRPDGAGSPVVAGGGESGQAGEV